MRETSESKATKHLGNSRAYFLMTRIMRTTFLLLLLLRLLVWSESHRRAALLFCYFFSRLVHVSLLVACHTVKARGCGLVVVIMYLGGLGPRRRVFVNLGIANTVGRSQPAGKGMGE